ncbi:MAG: hypothetical protein ACRDRX_26560 [Pseudonocardiaceae bacterium]
MEDAGIELSSVATDICCSAHHSGCHRGLLCGTLNIRSGRSEAIQDEQAAMEQRMRSKAQPHDREGSLAGHRQSSPRKAADVRCGAIQRSIAGIRFLTPPDMIQLQRAVGNRAVSRMLAGAGSSRHESAVVQRWPEIKSTSGTFTYTLGLEFRDKHVANDLVAAKKKAQQYYDPMHENPHNAAVTVIDWGSLKKVTHADEATAKGAYHWSLVIDVDAVMMGPSGSRGASGDPGALETISAVVVSGYSAGPHSGKITHVAASQ